MNSKGNDIGNNGSNENENRNDYNSYASSISFNLFYYDDVYINRLFNKRS